MNMRGLLRSLPVIGPLSYRLRPPRNRDQGQFAGSRSYWEQRYIKGGDSGAGSYNRLAAFKAEVIGELIAQPNIRSVIEFGCGDGAQLALTDYLDYTGVDVSDTILAKVRDHFADKPAYRFYHVDALPPGTRADLALSLDVIYHLVEDTAFAAYMASLCDAAEKVVVIYASNHDAMGDAPHVRHRNFTKWISIHRPEWSLTKTMPNRYPSDPLDPDNTSFADFYIFEHARDATAQSD